MRLAKMLRFVGCAIILGIFCALEHNSLADAYYNVGGFWKDPTLSTIFNPTWLGAESQSVSGFIAGGSSVAGTGDGMLGSPNASVTSPNGSYLYVADYDNNRINRYALPSGAAAGWIGKISTAPTGGDAGCNGASGITPGWCLGGTSTSGMQNGQFTYPQGLTLSADGSILYVAEFYRLSKYAATTGTFLGWVGGVNSTPTGGAAGCDSVTNGMATPGWCMGGQAIQGTSDGMLYNANSVALSADASYLFVSEQQNSRISRFETASGAFAGWLGAKSEMRTFGTGGQPTSGQSDGEMGSPAHTTSSPDGSYVYVADRSLGRIERFDSSSGAFTGWIGWIWGAPTGGDAGCAGANWQATPGWCMGGYAYPYQSSTDGALYYPEGIAASDSSLFVSDTSNNRVVKYDRASGIFSGWVGKVGGQPTGGSAGCDSTTGGNVTPGWCMGGYSTNGSSDGMLYTPKGMALTAGGSYLLVADNQNYRVNRYNVATGASAGWLGRAVGSSGAFITGGAGTSGSGDGQFQSVYASTSSPDGSYIYVLDSGSGRLQRFSSDGAFNGWIGWIYTAPNGGDAGCNGASGFTPGWCTGGSATPVTGANSGMGGMYDPVGIALVGSYLFVSDLSNNRVARYERTSGSFGGWIGKIASSPTGGDSGCNGASVGTFTPGWCLGGYAGNGSGEGMLYYPGGIEASVGGTYLYVPDRNNHRVNRYVTATGASAGWLGLMTGAKSSFTSPGVSGVSAAGDGQFSGIYASATSPDGSYVYVADVSQSRISRFSSDGAFAGWIGKISTSPSGGVAGCNGASSGTVTPGWCSGGTSIPGSVLGLGELNQPLSIAASSNGSYLYVGNYGGSAIMRYERPTGTFAGWIGKIATSPTGGDAGCNGAAVGSAAPGWCRGGTSTSGVGDGMINYPYGIADSPSGSYIYVSDYNNARVERFTSGGVFAGWVGRSSNYGAGFASGGTALSGTGNGQFTSPYATANSTDGSYVYVADQGNNRISRLLTSDGSFAGWIGWINSAPTGGDSGCSGASGFTPGWCQGGSGTSRNSGDGGMNGPAGVVAYGSQLYVSENYSSRIARYDQSSGAFSGWLGKIATSPTAGDAGCNGASTGTFTPGWCKGGSSNYGSGDGALYSPAALDVSPNGSFMYVADLGNHRVSRYVRTTGVFDGWIGGNAVLKAFATGGTPVLGSVPGTFSDRVQGTVVTPNGSFLYVTNASSIDKFDRSTGVYVSSIANAGAWQPAISPDGSSLYSLLYNRIVRYSTSTHQMTGWIGGIGSSPTGGDSGCAGASSGTFTPGWCLGGSSTNGSSSAASSEGLFDSGYYDLALSPNGSYLYVVDTNGAGKVQRYVTATGAFAGWIGKINTSPTGGDAGCNGATGLTPGWCKGGTSISGDGDGEVDTPIGVFTYGSYLYVPQLGGSRVNRFNLDVGTFAGWIGAISGSPTGGDSGCSGATGTTPGWCWGGSSTSGSGGFNNPAQGAVSPDGSYIYVTNFSGHNIVRYSTSGSYQGWVGRIGSSPTGGAAGCNGATGVTPGWCLGGSATYSTSDGGLDQASAMGVSPDGSYIYTGDYQYRVSRFEAASGAFAGWLGGDLQTKSSFSTGGSPKSGTLDGQFSSPASVRVSLDGSFIYAGDTYRIRRFNPDGSFNGWVGRIGSTPTGGAAGCTGASSGATPGWCLGGAPTTSAGDGSLYVTYGMALSPDNSTLYASTYYHHRLSRFTASSGAFTGWIGKVATSPTAGDAGCSGATVGTFTPGWCKGGTSTSGTGDGMMNNPYGLSASLDGSFLYSADLSNNRIIRFATSGAFAGWVGGSESIMSFGSGGTPRTGTGDGALNYPIGISASSDGAYIFVADAANGRISRFTNNGIFSGWVGYAGSVPTGGAAGCSGVTGSTAGWCYGGTATQTSTGAGFGLPAGISSDGTYLYATDNSYSRVQKFNQSSGAYLGWVGAITTTPTGGDAGCDSATAGSATPGWCLGGNSGIGASDGMVNQPWGMSSSPEGSYFYVTDQYNYRLTRFSRSGVGAGWLGGIVGLREFGIGGTPLSGNGDGQLSLPVAVTASSDGSYLFVIDQNSRISRYSSAGTFTGWVGAINSAPTGGVAGCSGASSFTPGWCYGGTSTTGSGDGQINYSYGVRTSGSYLYLADSGNHRIERFVSSSGAFGGWLGAIGSSPTGGAAGCNGASAGDFTPGWCQGGTSASGAGDGMLHDPMSLSVSAEGSYLLVADSSNYRLSRYDVAGTFAGWLGANDGVHNFAAGSGTAVSGNGDGAINYPLAVAAAPNGSYIYVSDSGNARVSRYTSAGLFKGWVGAVSSAPTGGASGCNGASGGTPGWCYGGTATSGTGDSMFTSPFGLAVSADSANLYVVDQSNQRTNRFTTSTGAFGGWIGKVASSPTGGDSGCNGAIAGTFTPGWCRGGAASAGSADGMMNYPWGAATSPDGVSLYVADSTNYRINRYATSTGAISGWLGKSLVTGGYITGGTSVAANGDGMLNIPMGLAASSDGSYLYVSEQGNHRLSRFSPTTGAFMGWLGLVNSSPNGGDAGCSGLSNGLFTDGWCTGGYATSSTDEGGLYSPTGLALSPGGTLIYVANYNSSRLNRFSSAGASRGWLGKIASAPTGGDAGCNGAAAGLFTPGWCKGGTSTYGSGDGMMNSPKGVGLSLDGTAIYVADTLNNRVNRYAASSGAAAGWVGANAVYHSLTKGGTPVATASDGSFSTPSHSALSPDGSYLFVTDSGQHRVNRFATSNGTFAGWIGRIGVAPTGGASGCSGTTGADTPGWCYGGASTAYGSSGGAGLSYPQGIATSPNGSHLYVADFNSSRIARYNPSTGAFTGWIGQVYSTSPTGGDAGCSGATTYAFTPGWCKGGTAYYYGGSISGAMYYPHGLSSSPDGSYLYVADQNKYRVARFASATGAFAGWVGKIGGSSPTGGAAGCSGATVGTATPGWCYGGGHTTGQTIDGGFSNPYDVTVSTDGSNIYALDYGYGRVQRFSASTGAFTGWIGWIWVSPTGGDTGCSGATASTYTPGWCKGGYSYPYQNNVDAAMYSPQGISASSTHLMVADTGNSRVDRYLLSTGAFAGWVGKIGSAPTGGERGCKSASAGTATKGWCKGGYATSGSGDGMFSSPVGVSVSGTHLYVADAGNSRIVHFSLKNVAQSSVPGTPAAFAFTNLTGVTLSTTATSNAVTLTGSVSNLTATCNAGCTAISRNGGSFAAGPVSGFNAGDTIAIQQVASASYLTYSYASVTVGTTVSSSWSVRSQSDGNTCDNAVVVLTSGTSYTISPHAGCSDAKIWAIGAGGGGAGSTNSDGTSGGGGAAGGVAYSTFTIGGGLSASYSLGSGGAGGVDASDGSAGGNTSLTISSTTITGNGGGAGKYNAGTTSSGGSYSGGAGGAAGGTGAGASGDQGGGSGGALGTVNGSQGGSGGAAGANPADISSLFASVTDAGYSTSGAGTAGGSGSSPSNAKNGGNATGFGAGGGGAGYYGGNGGAGYFGGGGGGAAGFTATNMTGGAGGSGVIVIQYQ